MLPHVQCSLNSFAVISNDLPVISSYFHNAFQPDSAGPIEPRRWLASIGAGILYSINTNVYRNLKESRQFDHEISR
jgi:hypothetical protein